MEGARRLLAGAAIGVAATWAVATLVDRCFGKKDAEVVSHEYFYRQPAWPVLLRFFSKHTVSGHHVVAP